MILRLLRKLMRLILYTIAKVDLINYEKLPKTGGCLVICNHMGRLDVLLGFILANRDDLIIMIAQKYEQFWLWRLLGNWIDTVWVNRDGTDTRALREVQKRLKAGRMAVIAPEGTRSPTQALIEAKPGAAYLAVKADVPIIPIALVGTEDHIVKQRLRRFRRLDLQVRVGEPFKLPSLPKGNKNEFLQEATDEMMCRIAALLPSQYHGVYADHPKLPPLQNNAGA